MKQKLLITSISTAIVVAALPFTMQAGPSPSPSAHASPKTTTSTEPRAETKTARAIPFRGKISAVDQNAKTFTIAGKETSRVFKVTDKTVITKDGAAATLIDVAVDANVTGSYWKNADGSLEAKSVKIGGAAATAETEKADKPKKKKSKKDEADASASPSPSAKP